MAFLVMRLVTRNIDDGPNFDRRPMYGFVCGVRPYFSVDDDIAELFLWNAYHCEFSLPDAVQERRDQASADVLQKDEAVDRDA